MLYNSRILILFILCIDSLALSDGRTLGSNVIKEKIVEFEYPEVFYQLKAAEDKMEYSDSGDIVLVFGIEKSTTNVLAHFLADDVKLKSERKENGQFSIVEDVGEDKSSEDENISFNCVNDIERDIDYYVFPNYDSQQSSVEIKSRYLLTKALSRAEWLKIILTLDYQSLARDSFDAILNLLTLTSQFIKNPETFQNSTLFFLTGVPIPSTVTNISRFSTYEGMFITELKEYLLQAKNYSIDETSQKLLDILLNVDDNASSIISFLSKPNEAGSIIFMENLQMQKRVLLARLEDTEYATASEDSFNPKLSEESSDVLYEMLETIAFGLNSTTVQIVDKIKSHYNLKLETSHDIVHLLSYEVIPNLSSLHQCVSSTSNFRSIVICVMEHEPEIYSLMEDYGLLCKKLNDWNSLQLLISQEVSDQFGPIWSDFENNLENLLNDFILWKDIFSSIIEDMKTYKKLILLNKRIHTEGIDEVVESITADLDCIKQCDEVKRNVLRKLLESVKQSELKYQCESHNGILTVTGDIIILSKVNYIALRQCKQTATRIDFFAFKKIFIDTIPLEIRNLHIGVVSPIIEAIDFNLEEYVSQLSDRYMFWSFSSTYVADIELKPSNYQLTLKPCKGLLSVCNKQAVGPELVRYRYHLIHHLKYTLDKTTCLNFYKEINNNHVYLINNSLTLVPEISHLEYLDLDQEDFLFIYEALKSNIKSYYNHFSYQEDTIQNKQVLEVLGRMYTFVLTKIYVIKSEGNKNLLFDMEDFLNLVLTHINPFEANLSKQSIEAYGKAYNNHIQVKIEDIQTFIIEHLTVSIDEDLEETILETEIILTEILQLNDYIPSDEEHLRKKLREFEEVNNRKHVASQLSITAKALGCFGGFAALLVNLIEKGVACMDTNTPMSSKQSTTLSDNVRDVLEKTTWNFEFIQKHCMLRLQNKVDAALYYLQDNRHMFESVFRKVSDIDSDLRNADSKKLNLRRIHNLSQDFDKEIDNLETYTRTPESSFMTTAAKVISRAVTLVDISAELFDAVKDDQGKLLEINDVLEEEKSKKELETYTIVSPVLFDMQEYVINLTRSFSLQSGSNIAESINEMKVLLENLNLPLIKIISNGLSSEDAFDKYIHKLHETTLTISNIYERIEQYRIDQNMAYFIGDMPAANTTTSMRRTINKLDQMISSNMVLTQYKRVLNSLNQYIFPFAQLPNLNQNDEKEILEMLKDGALGNFINDKVGKYLHRTVFDSRFAHTEAFYKWKNRDYKSEISNFLSGEPIYLYADVTDSDKSKNAIKFSGIGIELKHIQKQSQTRLETILKNYRVQMKHMGNSKYRYDQNYFLITSDDQDFRYNFEKDEQGYPTYSKLHHKMMNSTLLLSPYTMWRLQLINLQSNDFEELTEFRSKTDLHLVGNGQYVGHDCETCRFHLENHYKLDNPYYYKILLI